MTTLVVTGALIMLYVLVIHPMLWVRQIKSLIYTARIISSQNDFMKMVEEAEAFLKSKSKKSFKISSNSIRLHLPQFLSGLAQNYTIEKVGECDDKTWKTTQMLFKLTKKLPWYMFLDTTSEIAYITVDTSNVALLELKPSSAFDVKFGKTSVTNDKKETRICICLATRLDVQCSTEEIKKELDDLITRYTVIPAEKIDPDSGRPYVLKVDPVFNKISFEQSNFDLSSYTNELVTQHSYVNVAVKSGGKNYSIPMNILAKDLLMKVVKMKGDTNHFYVHGPVGSGKSGILKIAATQSSKYLEEGVVVIYLNVSELKGVDPTAFKTELDNLMTRTEASHVLMLVDESDPILTSEGEETSPFSGFLLSLMNGVDQSMFNVTCFFAGKKAYEDLSVDFQRRIGFPFSLPALSAKQSKELFNVLKASKLKEGFEPQIAELNKILGQKTQYSEKNSASLYEVFVLCFSKLNEEATNEIEKLLKEHDIKAKARSKA